MESIKVENIIQLTIFKCKICDLRLQAPILQVGGLWNICGSCYERSAYINVTSNSEIEAFLSTLYVPCNFAKRGCTFEGAYIKTCRHERDECRFRNRKCPFAYINHDCEYEYIDSTDIVKHIQENHTDSIINELLLRFEVQNPTESHPNCFYLIQVHNNTFILLRAMRIEQHICYAFYYFDNIKPENVHISSNAFGSNPESFEFMHESMISKAFPLKNACIVPLSTLEDLDCLENITIFNGWAICQIVGNKKISEINKTWVKCKKCLQIVKDVTICSRCNETACRKCGNASCCGYSTIAVDLEKMKASSEFLCENTGCNQIIKGDLYKEHVKWQCLKTKFKCIYKSCTFDGPYREHLRHMSVNHKHSPNNILDLQRNKWIKSFHSNGNDAFHHMYYLTEKNELMMIAIKLTEPFWTSDYMYIITIKSYFSIHQFVTIQGDYTPESYTKKVQLGDYITGSVNVTTLVKRI